MMGVTDGKETTVLLARIDDLCKSADRGDLAVSCFLSPRELQDCRDRLIQNGMRTRFFEWGGYADSERKKLFVLPEYMENLSEYAELSEYGYSPEMAAIEIRSSGFRRLMHRDFLGSVLGLGLQRSVIGDIFLFSDEKERICATLICETAVAPFICEGLCKVGNDTVTCRTVDIGDIKPPQREYKHISDTVSSARLDCVVASVLSLSREKAKLSVTEGIVEVDHRCVEDPSKIITAPCLLSIRGHGRFRINSLSDKTKKGRLRLDADKYI